MSTKTRRKPKVSAATMRKRRYRSETQGVYDVARNRVLVVLAEKHPDEYQDLMVEMMAAVRREKGLPA